ncbi:MAG: DUF600 family protein [Psychromonas sp.]|nr:DUF600 family protein [Alteromonadales bacterium]MCP5079291.1 DUF600 family protein [Psychromonas sp.]
MFENIEQIYNYIGHSMINALPTDWDKASFYALILNVDSAMQSNQEYWFNGNRYEFDVNKVNGVAKRTKCAKAFYSLNHIMQKNKNDVPWNKARFEITFEGDFAIDFKYDEDFAWYKALDIDSQEYDELDIDMINHIKSWDGLPENAPRYWRKS